MPPVILVRRIAVKVTRRLLKAMVAGNPGNFAGLGEWRYCHTCDEAFFARASEPDAGHADHHWSPLPALDPEGQDHLAKLFRQYMRRAFSSQRRAELATFARTHGWDLAYELQDGGGALTAVEVARWREVVEAEMERLVDQAEQIVAEGAQA
jgi:hypothetical protein